MNLIITTKTVSKSIPYVGTVLTVVDIAYRGYKLYEKYKNDKKSK